ncbi:MAG: hypothetical protein JJE04_22755 [Acidobacteriia bacterium]|nr:hypothetical protein [Terriglobia bacterium]
MNQHGPRDGPLEVMKNVLQATRIGLWGGRVLQPPDAENRTYGGVGGGRGAIPVTRPDRG